MWKPAWIPPPHIGGEPIGDRFVRLHSGIIYENQFWNGFAVTFSCPRFVIPLEIPLPTHHQEKYFDKLILCQNNEPFSPQLESSTTASIHGRGETRFLWEVKKP